MVVICPKLPETQRIIKKNLFACVEIGILVVNIYLNQLTALVQEKHYLFVFNQFDILKP